MATEDTILTKNLFKFILEFPNTIIKTNDNGMKYRPCKPIIESEPTGVQI